jgi:methylated-DNA-[protein]-cysteine S-methyltransferase
MTSDGEALTGLSFVDEPSALQVTQSLPVFAAACRWLDLYFSGKVPDFTPQLSLQGSDFRRAVWEILLTIPYGQTIILPLGRAKYRTQKEILLLKL